MPSLLTLTIAPALRAPARFVALVLLALAMLAAAGLDQLRLRVSSPAKKWGLITAFVGVLALEYAPLPVTTPVATPLEILWLAEQPRQTIVATYPYGGNLSTYQRIHQLPVIDSLAYDAALVRDNIYQIETLTIGSLDASLIGPKLAALGVRYVVNADAPLGQPPEGLELLFTTDTAQVFEVTSSPAPLVVVHTLKDGLWTSNAEWQWQAREFNILIWNPLNAAIELDVDLEVAERSPETELLAFRSLTPPPEQVVRSGNTVANPLMPPDYSPEPVRSETTPNGLVFQSLPIQPGETMLTLRWTGVPSEDALPSVTDIQFNLPNPPVEP